MDYSKHYNNLITKAKNRYLKDYKERHHIIPKSFGGSDEPNNIVELTAREHFVAHWLLARMYGGKMYHAFLLMAAANNYNQHRYTPSSRAYEEAKQKATENLRKMNSIPIVQYTLSGEIVKEYPSAWEAATVYGTVVYSCIRGKLLTAKGYIWLKKSDTIYLEDRIEKVKKHRTLKNKRILSKQAIVKKAQSLQKPVIQYTKSGEFVREWSSQKEVKDTLGLVIAPHLRGGAKSAGGYVWEYKN